MTSVRHPQTQCRRRQPRQSGFTLVELMISITLGLLILAGVTSVFLGSKRSFRTQESMGQIQESGRFLNYLMFPYVRIAGYLPNPLFQNTPDLFFAPGADMATDTRRAIWGVDGGTAVAATGTAAAAGVNYATGSDVLVVRYMGQDGIGAAPGATDNVFRTCRGLPAGFTGLNANQMAENVFFVSRSENPAIPDSLSCRATVYTLNAATGAIEGTEQLPAQPLLRGVTDMQILYGVDTDPVDDAPPPPGQPGLAPNRYFVANDPAATFDWQRVVTVRVEVTSVGAEQTESADVGGGTANVADDFVEDRRLQRTFSTTLTIRNRLRT